MDRLTEQKKYWLAEGVALENAFIEKYGKKLGLIINPGKVEQPYLPDLHKDNGENAELKSQLTPFHYSKQRYKIPVEYAFTFDEYSALRYAFYYPNLEIYFWMLHGEEKVYKTTFTKLREHLLVSPVYIQLRRSNMNTLNKAVFVMDLRSPVFERVV
jgi:hypothetical protein